MKVGVPRESADGERRVALVPDVVKRLGAKDVEVVVEAGAGERALIPDALYTEAGATIGDPWGADVVVKVGPPSAEEIGHLARAVAPLVSGWRKPISSAPERIRAMFAGSGGAIVTTASAPQIAASSALTDAPASV